MSHEFGELEQTWAKVAAVLAQNPQAQAIMQAAYDNEQAESGVQENNTLHMGRSEPRVVPTTAKCHAGSSPASQPLTTPTNSVDASSRLVVEWVDDGEGGCALCAELALKGDGKCDEHAMEEAEAKVEQ